MKPIEKKDKDKKEDGKRGEMVHFDYKNAELLTEYINQNARIMNRRRTTLSSREQHLLSQAVKRARYMALMPYIAR